MAYSYLDLKKCSLGLREVIYGARLYFLYEDKAGIYFWRLTSSGLLIMSLQAEASTSCRFDHTSCGKISIFFGCLNGNSCTCLFLLSFEDGNLGAGGEEFICDRAVYVQEVPDMKQPGDERC